MDRFAEAWGSALMDRFAEAVRSGGNYLALEGTAMPRAPWFIQGSPRPHGGSFLGGDVQHATYVARM
jgi:hypothetical protein